MSRSFVQQHLLFMSGLGLKLRYDVVLHLRAPSWFLGLDVHRLVEQVVQRVEIRFGLGVDDSKNLSSFGISLDLDFLCRNFGSGPWTGDGERVAGWGFDIFTGLGYFLLRPSRGGVQPGTQSKAFVVLRQCEFTIPVVCVSSEDEESLDQEGQNLSHTSFA